MSLFSGEHGSGVLWESLFGPVPAKRRVLPASLRRLEAEDPAPERRRQNGRLQNVELAKMVGLSPSPCLRRVKLLEEAGVIERYVALLNPAKIGVGLTLFARIWLTAQDEQTVERFTEVIRRVPQVVECHLMAGDSDFLLRVVAKDLDDYRRFQIAHLTRSNGVQSIKTEIPMQRIKQSTELPL